MNNDSHEQAYSLVVNFGDKVIGSLRLNQNTHLLDLSYNNKWKNEGFPLSPALSLDNQHSAEVAYNYLDNILPEGNARNLLALNLGVSEKNVYSQIRELGHDLAGAITFTKKSMKNKQTSPIFRPLQEPELISRLNNKEQFGLLTWDNKPRLSVAGVQDKLNVLIYPNGDMGFADGSLCSTHILKFENSNCPNLVINEYFCMKLSQAVGLPTAEIDFRKFGEHPTLIVKRFDRKFVSDVNATDSATTPKQKVLRRHVIDGCQVLNLSRENKYERNLGDGRDVKHIRDGASLKKLFVMCKSMSSPIESTKWLINWQLFNLMINNYDSHGKNISLFFNKNNSQFTPAYDLVNVSLFPQFKHVLAMAMGDEFAPEHIHAYQLADFAETCGIDKKLLTRMLISLSEKVLTALRNHLIMDEISDDKHFSMQDFAYLKTLSVNIAKRTEYLKSQAAEIASIQV